MSLTKHQKQKARRLREDGRDCCEIATALSVEPLAVSSFFASEHSVKLRSSPAAIARLVTEKDPEVYMRRRRVWYGPRC